MKVYVSVLHFLLLNQVAQSFVLLTANIEDIKKLAKKFVSESLAENIADFIAKAAEQMMTNVSDENARNENHFQDISTENIKIYKKVRQRNEKEDQHIPKQRYQKIKNDIPRKPMKKVRRTTKEAIDKRPQRPGRVDLKDMPLNKTNNVSKLNKKLEKSHDKYNAAKQYSYKQRPTVVKNKPHPTKIRQLDSTIGAAEKTQQEKNLKYQPEQMNIKNKFLIPNRYRLTANSKENETVQPNDFSNWSNMLTTKKRRLEFDQYENFKYPAKYVATSGPVALPKVPSENGWNKEKEIKRNKYWD